MFYFNLGFLFHKGDFLRYLKHSPLDASVSRRVVIYREYSGNNMETTGEGQHQPKNPLVAFGTN